MASNNTQAHLVFAETMVSGPPGTFQLPRPVHAFQHHHYRAWYTIETFDRSLRIGSDVILATQQHDHFVGKIYGIGYINPTDTTADLALEGVWAQNPHQEVRHLHLIVSASNLAWIIRSRLRLRNFFWWLGGFILPAPDSWLQPWSLIPSEQVHTSDPEAQLADVYVVIVYPHPHY